MRFSKSNRQLWQTPGSREQIGKFEVVVVVVFVDVFVIVAVVVVVIIDVDKISELSPQYKALFKCKVKS